MAIPNSLKETYLEITTGSGTNTVTVSFIIQANPANYPAAMTTAGSFTANEPSATDRAKTADVVTPVGALIKSGSFRRLVASGMDGARRKHREVVVPSKAYELIKAAIETTPMDIGGLSCDTVEVGQRSRSR
ncbi:hypothetical protein [Pseudanabaena sp. 'Roaring Creek']|uniref:hypothetical protein n=1 Tax=Pseudanabaena sp. 'Roaring Creek' TaxID=1681830 RepID=UPI0006D7B647|nr:hypothetical protein [Pseudanabaena sp. 'Roaring Creek']